MGLLPHGPFSPSQVEAPYYPSQSHEAARKAALLCLGDGEKGFFLAGPAGAGKTTVLRQILKHQAIPGEVLFVNSALPLSRREFIQSLLFDCQLPMEGTEVELHLRLTDHLAGILGSGQTIWIVLDDAGILDKGAFMELVGLTRLPGKGGARLQILLTGDHSSWESGCLADVIPRIEIGAWTSAELADWIRQTIGATKGAPVAGPGRELMDLLAPEGTGLPGLTLATLRCAWRLVGDPAVIYPNPATVSRALQGFSAGGRQVAPRRESRRPLDCVENPVERGHGPILPELDFEGMEEWMAGATCPAFSWEQGG